MNERRSKVVVLDDDISVRRSLGRLLKSAGYDVEIMESTDEFLQRAPFDDVGCLLLDIQMPGPNGMELQNALARSNCAPPIVFITGNSDLPISQCAIEACVIDFLVKPFNDEMLLKAVDKALLKWRQDKDMSCGDADHPGSSQK
jgi:FixJ family two-component response regulator